MSAVRSLIAFFVFVAVTLSATGAFAQNPEEHLLKGDMFYFEGDYYRAITEYKTYLLESAGDQRNSRVDLKIAWIYHLAERPQAAQTLLRNIALQERTELEGWWARLYNAEVALGSAEPLRARRAYESIVKDCEPVVKQSDSADGVSRSDCLDLTTRARLGLAKYWARLDQFDKAAEQLGYIPRSAPQAPDAQKVAEYVSTLEIPQKNPAVAGVLSVVPGLGHFYLEEWGVGVVAMIWNGAFIFATADSFIAGRYGQGALLGLLEVVWYAGTIFGAVSGAHRFNRDAMLIVREGLTKDLDRIGEDVPWPARFPVQYPTPLQLKFEFD